MTCTHDATLIAICARLNRSPGGRAVFLPCLAKGRNGAREQDEDTLGPRSNRYALGYFIVISFGRSVASEARGVLSN